MAKSLWDALERPTKLSEEFASVIWAEVPISALPFLPALTHAETVGNFFKIVHNIAGDFIDDIVINPFPVDQSTVTPITTLQNRTPTLWAAMEMAFGLYSYLTPSEHLHVYNPNLGQAIGVKMELVNGDWHRWDWQKVATALVPSTEPITDTMRRKHYQLAVVLSGMEITMSSTGLGKDDNIFPLLEESLAMPTLEAMLYREERMRQFAARQRDYNRAKRADKVAEAANTLQIFATVDGIAMQDLVALGERAYKVTRPDGTEQNSVYNPKNPVRKSWFADRAKEGCTFETLP